MANSLPPVKLPVNEWVDLYDKTGLTVGTKLIIQNSGSNDAILTESALLPTSGYGFNPLPKNSYVSNSTGNIGAWAKSTRGTTLQIEEA